MQDLHGDPPARVMHAVGDLAVVGDVLIGVKSCRTWKNPAFGIGGHAPVTINPTPPRARVA